MGVGEVEGENNSKPASLTKMLKGKMQVQAIALSRSESPCPQAVHTQHSKQPLRHPQTHTHTLPVLHFSPILCNLRTSRPAGHGSLPVGPPSSCLSASGASHDLPASSPGKAGSAHPQHGRKRVSTGQDDHFIFKFLVR